MSTQRTMKWGLVVAAVASGAVLAAVPGCELLVSFDRSLIPQEGGAEDGTVGDGPGNDGESDSSSSSGSSSGSDSSADSSSSGADSSSSSGADSGSSSGDSSVADSSMPDAHDAAPESSVTDTGVMEAAAEGGANGSACTVGSQCGTGHCSNDGVCCDQACTGNCMACTAALKGTGSDGTCGNVKAGSAPVPASQCAAAAMSTCGLDGFCNGSGACQDWATGTICLAPVCSANMQTTASTCTAPLTCTAGTTTSCSNFACSGTACGTSCSVTGTPPAGTSTGCIASAYCDTVPSPAVCATTLKATGATCNNDFECLNGTCTGGPGGMCN